MDLPEKVKRKLRDAPDGPGCYLMRDRRGKIIYVGKASSLRKRVRSYFRDGTLRSATPKVRGLVKSVWDLDYIVVRNDAEAGLTEGRLIKEYRPRYNVSFRDDKRFLVLRTDPKEPYPRFRLGRIQRDDGARYFGPYASAAAARATLDFVEKKFGLRKCEPRVPDAGTYERCLNDIIRYCSAPCVGRTSGEDYRERFEETCAFLRGERPAILKEMRARMEEAATARDFEEAAALRDTLLLLTATVRQNARVAPTPRIRAEVAEAGINELRAKLGLAGTPRVIEGYDISNISGTHSVASMVCFVDGVPRRNRYRRFRIRSVEGSDDPGMMAEVIRRRFARLLEEGGERPSLVLVDGGVTQLAAARSELVKLGLGTIPVAALAKRFEEIHWQEREPPILLPRDSRALNVLQHLRDEAHRFALTYHRQLRSRRIRESALDEVPGIGEKRKAQLLAHFGSVRRLMKASEDEIARVPGIGPEMATAIRARLGVAGSAVAGDDVGGEGKA